MLAAYHLLVVLALTPDLQSTNVSTPCPRCLNSKLPNIAKNSVSSWHLRLYLPLILPFQHICVRSREMLNLTVSMLFLSLTYPILTWCRIAPLTPLQLFFIAFLHVVAKVTSKLLKLCITTFEYKCPLAPTPIPDHLLFKSRYVLFIAGAVTSFIRSARPDVPPHSRPLLHGVTVVLCDISVVQNKLQTLLLSRPSFPINRPNLPFSSSFASWATLFVSVVN